MRIAIVYNRDSRNVINLFGTPNREKIGLKTIKRVADALKEGKHQVITIEADKDLIARLEDFMPKVVAGEQPGMVFNVSYGIQGRARYTHVPSILEMVGIPYVASGPLAHSLALDKVVTKMLLRQNGLPTPDFAVLDHPEAELPELRYPMIVKPKNEAVSFGLAVVDDEPALREATKRIFDRFEQPVLAEQYIEGKEVNVGVLGNSPPEAFPPVELLFGDGPQVYTYEDKTSRSGRTIGHRCPADLSPELTERVKDIALKSFRVLEINDCARVDMRIDGSGEPFVLELNSLPSLGEHGSYLVGAQAVGLDFGAFVRRLVDVAAARYFGTPAPPSEPASAEDAGKRAFGIVTKGRDALERRLREWTDLARPTDDQLALSTAHARVARTAQELGLQRVDEACQDPGVFTYETEAGLEGGLLLVSQLDVPIEPGAPWQRFRREPEWLVGTGVASSAASLALAETALKNLKRLRQLRRRKLGWLVYADEGRWARTSRAAIERAAGLASGVLVLSPTRTENEAVVSRRGHRLLRLVVEGRPRSIAKRSKALGPLEWLVDRMDSILEVPVPRRCSLSLASLRSERQAPALPHRAVAELLIGFDTMRSAEQIETQLRAALESPRMRWSLDIAGERPPRSESPANEPLTRAVAGVAERWKIPLELGSSAWPGIDGWIPADTSCISGLAPPLRDDGAGVEAVQRLGMVQRTLLLTQLLLAQDGGT